MSQNTTVEQNNQELRQAALDHDEDLFSNKYKMPQIINSVEGALYIAQMDAKSKGGKPGNYIAYKRTAGLTKYTPRYPEEVCSKSAISPDLALRIIRFFEQDPKPKLNAFKKDMDAKYKKWEKWYLEKHNNNQQTVDRLPRIAHNDENWQRETDALISTQIYINDVYADFFSVFQTNGSQDENINAAMKAVHSLGCQALPGVPDIFNPSNVNRHCFVGQLKDINKYFKAIFSRSHHITRDKCKTLEGFLYFGTKHEIENVHDLMYQNAYEIAKANMLFWTAQNNK